MTDAFAWPVTATPSGVLPVAPWHNQPDPACLTCGGEGWVCEAHPERPWGEGDGCCGAPGAACPCLEAEWRGWVP